MIVIKENTELAVTSGNFVEAVIGRCKSTVGITEKKNGEHNLEHPFIAFSAFMRKLRGAENKAERDAIESELRAQGITDAETIDKARASVKSTYDNGRVTVAMLKRLHGETITNPTTGAKALPIELVEGSDDYKALVKGLKQSVGGWQGHVDAEAVRAIANGLSVIFANAKDSTVTALDLGFTADAMDAFLKGGQLQIAEAIEAEAVNVPNIEQAEA